MKENQPALCSDAKLYFDTIATDSPIYESLEKDHGRLEKRTYSILTERAWDYDWEMWTNLRGIGMVRSHACEKGIVREDTRYFITSLKDVREFADAVRKRWTIESQLHWNLNVIFREDAARARKEKSPLNMNVLRKTALAIEDKVKIGRFSKKKKMFMAALNPERLIQFLFPDCF